MSRYWVFHEQRLKGPLEPEALRALTGFTLDMRVCPEGGPETDWRPAREHDAIAAAFGKPPAAASPPAALPTIPKLAPVEPAPAPPLVAADDGRLRELERRVAELEAEVARLKARPEPKAFEPPPAAAPLAEPPALFAPPPFSPLEHPIGESPALPALEPLPPPPPLELPAFQPLQPPPEIQSLPEGPSFEPPSFEPPAPAAAPAPPAPPAPRAIRVLAADDDELMRQAIASAFRGEGFEIEVVGDGKTALERIATDPYDLVILDEGMPSGSGFQVARAVCKLDADSRPKVLLFTAQYVGNKLARETFLASGADDVLSKDAGMAGLLKKARELLKL